MRNPLDGRITPVPTQVRPYSSCDRAGATDQITAGEDTAGACHHIRSRDDGAVRVQADSRDAAQEVALCLLSEGENNRIRL
jgi:hypothetical protein